MTRRYKSEALAAVHETALGLAEAGVTTKRTMRAFDETCLTPVEEMTPEDIRTLQPGRGCVKAPAVFAPSRGERGAPRFGKNRDSIP